MHRRTAAASAGVRRADADARPPRARGAIVDRARVAPLAAALVAALALALVALVVVASSSSWASSSSSPPPPPRGDPRARVASSTRATDDVELEPTTAAAATTTTTPATRLVTPDELATRNGVDDPSLWLAIVGRVFDVTRGGGARHYARGMPYAGFVGRDGTRAFATGRFDEDGLVPDVDGLSDDEILGVRRWLEFYEGGSEERDAYREIGVLAGGHYYDANGVETRRKLAFDAAANRAEGRARDDSAREALWRTCARKTRSGASRLNTLVPVRPRSRGGRRSSRTDFLFPSARVSLRSPPLGFDPDARAAVHWSPYDRVRVVNAIP